MPPRSALLDPAAIIRRTLAVLGVDLPAYVLVALVLVGAPTLVSDSALAETSAPAVVVVALLLQVLLTTIVLHSVLARVSGQPLSILQSLAPGLRFWLLAFAVELVTGVAVMAGFVLLIVPGIILALRWLVPVPAIMAEGLGIGGALRRSTELTTGQRLPLFGLVVAWAVPFLLVPTLVIPGLQQADAPAWVVAAVDMVTDMAGTLTSAAGLGVIYHELRQIKDGDATVVRLFE